MSLKDIEGLKFIKSPNKLKKYRVVVNNKTIDFGSSLYQHYKDLIPKDQGGQLWTHKDHNDPKRRDNYRKRHRGLLRKDGKHAYKIKYTPAWFSYNFLW